MGDSYAQGDDQSMQHILKAEGVLEGGQPGLLMLVVRASPPAGRMLTMRRLRPVRLPSKGTQKSYMKAATCACRQGAGEYQRPVFSFSPIRTT